MKLHEVLEHVNKITRKPVEVLKIRDKDNTFTVETATAASFVRAIPYLDCECDVFADEDRTADLVVVIRRKRGAA